ncbi:MAG: hypothetical protein AB1847_13225 [bacterium]
MGQNIPDRGGSEIRLWTGYWKSSAEASWQTSFPCGTGNCISKLNYHDLDAGIFSLEIDIVHSAPRFGLNFLFGVAPITKGRSQDTDFENSIKSSESRNPVDGRVDLWSLEGLLPLTRQPLILFRKKTGKPLLSWQWHWIVGVQHYQDSLRMYDGKPIARSWSGGGEDNRARSGSGDSGEESFREELQSSDQDESFAWLDSHYTFIWDAIKIGVKSTWDVIPDSFPFCYSLAIGGKITPLVAHYLGEGIWNLKEEFAQDPSFRHKAYGYGLGAEFSVTYCPFPPVGLELGWQYLFLSAENGSDTTYYYSGEKGESQLDEVRLQRKGWLFRVTVSF